MTVLQDEFTLWNGLRMPKVGFGTWQITDAAEAYEATSSALACGYRHIDTARVYGNEDSVGRAVRDSGIPRSEIFVTSKLPAEIKDPDEALASFETTMATIGLEHLDCYLIHAPWPWHDIGRDCSAGNKAIWKAFEAIYRSGRAKAIGVSNFNVRDLAVILDGCSIKPMVNQIRFFIGNTQEEVVDFCRGEDIRVTAYSPLATGKILQHPDIVAVAQRCGKSVAQVCIRYVIQKGLGPLPKSTRAERIRENADVDFEMTSADMSLLDRLNDTDKVHHGQEAT
ncbi:aldo/keto reductase [Sphingomonas sp.]|uniref:aldo/keto reductase n=1 Tax=Sphingomonas sp. TaxID=28214 RepID=UPI0017B880AD|nr:aldo/keto reductase [Sphingomonas sp.]MBA3512051.1 aldo/keto reductase [Sphingomonas sp.]